jgi:hypothetical protein
LLLSLLLATLSYDPQSDELIHVGDIVAKGPHQGSLSVLKFMATGNITGVRGNHDQKVIEWRSWLDWILPNSDGKSWLTEMDEKWTLAKKSGIKLEVWTHEERQKSKSKWWKKIPDGLFGDHFQVARDMTTEQYNYLLSLPLILHVPSAHAYVAHGGLLSSDPKRKPSHRRQPLAHIPAISDTVSKEDRTALLRQLQEIALLHDVPQNRDPWVVLNMRGVLNDQTVTR